MSNNLYGFDTSDEVEYDGQGLPVGIYKAMAVSEEPFEKDGTTQGVIVEWEVLEGDHKGKKGKVWYNTLHDSKQTANIAKQTLKRIGDASGKPISESAPIKGRVCVLDVQKQKKDDRYTEVKRYLPENHKTDEAPF